MGDVINSSCNSAPATEERTSQIVPCSSVGFLPQGTVLHKLLRDSFPWAAVPHYQLQCGSLPCGAVFQEQPASSFCLIHRSCLQPGPAQLSHGLFSVSTCSGTGPSPGCRWISPSPGISMRCREPAILTVGCTRSPQLLLLEHSLPLLLH